MQRVLNLIGPDGSKKVARRLLNAGAKVGMTLGYMVRPRMVLWVSGPWLALSPQNIRESNERKTGWAQDAVSGLASNNSRSC